MIAALIYLNQHPLVLVAEMLVFAFSVYGIWRTWTEIRDGK